MSIRRKFAAVFILAELGFAGGAYVVWRKLKSSSDFRYKCYTDYRPVLLGFYDVYQSSKAVPSITLKEDIEIWIKQGKPVEQK